MRRSMDVDANVCVAVTLVFATLFTVARFWARYLTKVNLWVDDWFALAAYVSIFPKLQSRANSCSSPAWHFQSSSSHVSSHVSREYNLTLQGPSAQA